MPRRPNSLVPFTNWYPYFLHRHTPDNVPTGRCLDHFFVARTKYPLLITFFSFPPNAGSITRHQQRDHPLLNQLVASLLTTTCWNPWSNAVIVTIEFLCCTRRRKFTVCRHGFFLVYASAHRSGPRDVPLSLLSSYFFIFVSFLRKIVVEYGNGLLANNSPTKPRFELFGLFQFRTFC